MFYSWNFYVLQMNTALLHVQKKKIQFVYLSVESAFEKKGAFEILTPPFF